MATRKEEVWDAKPHTRAKVAILRAYLDAWFPIMGRSRPGESILYVDGFAGPGRYANEVDGSPVAAVQSAVNAVQTNRSEWKAGPIHCVFIEEDAAVCSRLQRNLADIVLPREVTVDVLQGRFADRLGDVRRRMPKSFNSRRPLFAFVDPFGAKGVPFEMVADLLESPCSEVMLNFDADGISRIHEAGAYANHVEILNSIYGGPSWQQILGPGKRFALQCREATDFFMRRLKALPEVRYSFRFEMRGANDTLNYYLIFASKHRLGLKKMKEAMGQVDQTGEYCFSDGAIGQWHLFDFKRPEVHAPAMHEALLGQTLSLDQVDEYVLNCTPFTTISGILAVLEDEGKLDLRIKPGSRRKTHQFSDATIESIKFVEPPRTLFDGN